MTAKNRYCKRFQKALASAPHPRKGLARCVIHAPLRRSRCSWRPSWSCLWRARREPFSRARPTRRTGSRMSASLQINVGADWFQFCSGTLVRSDRRPARPRTARTSWSTSARTVSARTISSGSRSTRSKDGPYLDGRPHRRAPRLVHPSRGGSGNSKHGFLAPPAEDIALVFLDAPGSWHHSRGDRQARATSLRST